MTTNDDFCFVPFGETSAEITEIELYIKFIKCRYGMKVRILVYKFIYIYKTNSLSVLNYNVLQYS